MGKFRPTKLAFTIFGISIITVVILLQLTSDVGVALEIASPELRVVGGCFRNCLDPDQTGFGTVNGEVIIPEDTTGTVTNPDGSTMEEPVSPDGIIGTDPTTTPTDGDQTININGQEFEVLQLTNPIACWVSVDANILDTNGNVIATEKSSVLKFAPRATLSLTDVPTGIGIEDQGGFDLMLKIQCSTNTETGGLDPEGDLFNFFNPFNYPSFDTPLKLDATRLTARVYSSIPEDFPLLRIAPTERLTQETLQDIAGGTLVDTFNFPLEVPAFDIFGATPVTIGTLKIPSERILEFLPDGSYGSRQNIVLDGTLVLHWATEVAEVDNISYAIPLITTRTQNQLGQDISVFNPVKIERDIFVEKGTGEIMQQPMCENNQISQGELCIDTDPTACPQGEVKVGQLCVDTGTDKTPNPTTENIFSKLLVCIGSGDPSCLASGEFLPFWIFGIGLVIVLGAVAQRRQPDIYGVPT